jgi:hypothetical protein
MIILTGEELDRVDGDHIDRPVISVLCQNCLNHVAWVSLAELAGMMIASQAVFCFACDPDQDAQNETVDLAQPRPTHVVLGFI